MDVRYALNAICPYFTMFPLEYPMRVLNPRRLSTYRKPIVFDPYCGRGTAVFAARLRGVPAYGSDVAPVAVAIARAKLAVTTANEVLALATQILDDAPHVDVPTGDFWQLAYHKNTLRQLSVLREGLLKRRAGDSAVLLRAVILGALHGPRVKTNRGAGYFSNQMPRTFAAKPDYAVRYWDMNNLRPREVDVLAVIRTRVNRILGEELPDCDTAPEDIACCDSRTARAYRRIPGRITHVVTSPPYYGLRTYSQDQWLRLWFLGGPATVDYSADPGLDHGSPEAFAESLSRTWDQIGSRAAKRIQLYIRFGGINSRSMSAESILRDSLNGSHYRWRIVTRRTATSANTGKRQAVQMTASKDPVEEYDYVVSL